jgi:4-methyl-5(b-hydroxyethyl)-thiazole monophosphate biosynthesis
MKRVLVPLAEGFEELEAVTIIDILRRAGVEVVVASLAGSPVAGAHGIRLEADAPLEALLAQHFDMIALPGGMPGAEHLRRDPRIAALVKRLHAAGRPVAAICAAPMVLAAAGLLAGRRATSYPGFLDGAAAATVVGDTVVVDRGVITSRGPGTALDFALALVEELEGRAARQAIESRLERDRPAAA